MGLSKQAIKGLKEERDAARTAVQKLETKIEKAEEQLKVLRKEHSAALDEYRGLRVVLRKNGVEDA